MNRNKKTLKAWINKDMKSAELAFKNRCLDFEKDKMAAIERFKSQTIGIYQLTLAVKVTISSNLNISKERCSREFQSSKCFFIKIM